MYCHCKLYHPEQPVFYKDAIHKPETFSKIQTAIILCYNQLLVGAQVLKEAPYWSRTKDTLHQKYARLSRLTHIHKLNALYKIRIQTVHILQITMTL